MMYKHRNEDSALTAVFGGLTLLTTGAWAFLLTYEYYPTLFFFEYPFLEKNMKLTMLIVSFSSLVSICTWLYLIYPSIKKREETLNEMLEREANSKFLLGEDDKVLLSARIDNDLTAKEQAYVDNLLENSAQARRYLQTLMLVDQKTREFFRLDCPYCGENKNEGYHYKCWIR